MRPLQGAFLDEDLPLRIARCVATAAIDLRNRTKEAAVQIVGKCTADLSLDDREAELLQGQLGMLQLLELDECEVEVLEEGPMNRDVRLDNFHLPLDGNLAGADSGLEVFTEVHVAGIAGQVRQVDGSIGVLGRDIDAAVVLSGCGAFREFNKF